MLDGMKSTHGTDTGQTLDSRPPRRPDSPPVARRALLRGSLALGAAAALATLRTPPVAANGGSLDPAPNPSVAMLETGFLAGMIPHHRGAIMMTEMAAMKAARPELRQLAGTIIAAQMGEIAVMTHLLRDWYGQEPPVGTMMPRAMMDDMMMPMMRGLMPDMGARMVALQAKAGGAAFDIEFMSAMTDHHAMAIMMAAPVLMAAHHAYLYTLAENIVISQGEEIRQMDEWLDTWYQVGRPL